MYEVWRQSSKSLLWRVLKLWVWAFFHTCAERNTGGGRQGDPAVLPDTAESQSLWDVVLTILLLWGGERKL